jgi:hypothetical protein
MTETTISDAGKLACKRLSNRALPARLRKSMSAGSAEAPSKHMLAAMAAFCDGNFSVRLPLDWEGADGTTERNREQDWLKTNLARFAGMLQGHREVSTVGELLLSEFDPLVRAYQGTIYHLGGRKENRELRLLSNYACTGRPTKSIRPGEGLAGQCALEKRRILVDGAPPAYFGISSRLGEAPRVSIVVLPVLFEGEMKEAGGSGAGPPRVWIDRREDDGRVESGWRCDLDFAPTGLRWRAVCPSARVREKTECRA